MDDYKETLRSLALGDERCVGAVLGVGYGAVGASELDQKTHALVRLAAMLAIRGTPSAYQSAVEPALAAGATMEELVGTLVAVAPTIGLARVASAAPDLALAVGYDVDAAFEGRD